MAFTANDLPEREGGGGGGNGGAVKFQVVKTRMGEWCGLEVSVITKHLIISMEY